MGRSPKKRYFERSPPWQYFVIVSDISSGSIYVIYFLTVYSGIWHSVLAFYLTFYSDTLSGILSGIYSDIFSGILFGIHSGILLGIYSDIFSGIYSVWSSNFSKKATWYMPYFLQVYFLTFFPASFLVYLRRLIVVEVWRGTLWSSARGGGPAGNTLIRSLRWRSGGDHFDPEVAVRVRRGTVWSKACSWGPAGMTLIQRLLFGPREHCDLELAVEVRLGTLRSRAYSLTVEVGRRKEEEGWGGTRRAGWHKI